MRLEVGSMLTRITLAAVTIRRVTTTTVHRTCLALLRWRRRSWLVVLAIHALGLMLFAHDEFEQIHEFHRSMLLC